MRVYRPSGIFRIPFVDINQDLQDLHRTNKWFSNLKHSLNRHLDIKMHTNALEHNHQVARRRISSADKNFLAAKTIVRTAYLSIKLGDSNDQVCTIWKCVRRIAQGSQQFSDECVKTQNL